MHSDNSRVELDDELESHTIKKIYPTTEIGFLCKHISGGRWLDIRRSLPNSNEPSNWSLALIYGAQSILLASLSSMVTVNVMHEIIDSIST